MGLGKRKHQWVPCRTEKVVSRSVGEELVVYDPGSAQTHALNCTAAAVFAAVDGHRDLHEVVEIVSGRLDEAVDEEVVVAALSELSETGLTNAPPARWDRRVIVRTAGLAGAVAAPLIASVGLPSIADAQSGGSGGSGGTGGGPGGGEDDSATVTSDGSLTFTTFSAPTSYASAEVDLTLSVIATTTSVTSGTMSSGPLTGPFDLFASPTVISGPFTIIWDDSPTPSTSSGTFDLSVSAFTLTAELDLSITSGLFSSPPATMCTLTTSGTLIPSGTIGDSPLSGALQFSNPLVLEACEPPAPATPLDGVVTTFAGPSGLISPKGVAFAPDGQMYVMDEYRVLGVSTSGVASVLAGGTTAGHQNGPGSSALFAGHGIGARLDGSWGTQVLIAEHFAGGHDRIQFYAPDVDHAQPYTGSGIRGYVDGTKVVARFAQPRDVAVAADGTAYVADRLSHSIRAVAPYNQSVSTLAGGSTFGLGNGGFADGTGSAALFREPYGVDVSSDGTVYVADYGNNAVRTITPSGVVTTLATGVPGPHGVAVAPNGIAYVASVATHQIYAVSESGTVSVVAGNGSAGFADGTGTAAEFDFPDKLAFGPDGALYVTDRNNNRIRKIV